ncbi:MAG: hypothetical protein PF440_06700 [Thiomicrorhabdus sp.]|jgi:hypothetical protein|nr:hypothetical protein [Thiomicrorhabdus sp.]
MTVENINVEETITRVNLLIAQQCPDRPTRRVTRGKGLYLRYEKKNGCVAFLVQHPRNQTNFRIFNRGYAETDSHLHYEIGNHT